MTNQRPPARAQWRFVILLLLLAASWLGMLIGGSGSVDRAIYQAVYAGHRPALRAVAHILTLLGEPTLLIAASVLVALWLSYLGRGRAGAVLLAVILIGRAVTELQKYWVARARPDLEAHLVVVKTSSFPSGHAAGSMMFYLALALMLTAHSRLRFAAAAAAVLVSLLVGISRVMLGVHWPSDVIGGWSFGLLWVLLTLRPAERLLRSDSEMEQSRV
jgi:undecaprenyl-diphosphatase